MYPGPLWKFVTYSCPSPPSDLPPDTCGGGPGTRSTGIASAHFFSAQEEPPERKKKTRAPKKPKNVESTQCATTKDYETTEETSQASTTGDRSPQIYIPSTGPTKDSS